MNEIVEFNAFEQELKVFHETYDGVVYDLRNPEDEKAARSDRLAIGKVISRLDAAHKQLKAPLKEKTDLLDAERKRIKDLLLGVQGKIKSQIETHENKIRDHAAALENRVAGIGRLCIFDVGFQPAIGDLETRLELAHDVVVDSSFEKREADAALAKMKTIDILEEALKTLHESEAETAELARFMAEEVKKERAARDAEIRKEAETKAKADAKVKIDKANQQRKDAELAAEQAIIDAEQKAKEAVEIERKRVANIQAADDKALKLRQKDEKHLANIIAEIEQDFVSVGLGAEAGNAARALADGLIRNVEIKL